MTPPEHTTPDEYTPPEDTPAQHAPPPEHTRPPADAAVELVGEHRTRVGAEDLAALPNQCRTVEIACASGSRHVSNWGGVAIPDLLSAGEVPAATTHLVIESTDGHTVCVGVEGAVAGLLAWARDGRPLVDEYPYANRFVSPDVDGARTVKAVRRIETIALSADERPGDFETLATETPEMDG